jgi:4-hydroxy-tetrahydrodipicolinate synthase
MKSFTGSFAALPCPIKDGKFDVDSYRFLIEHLLANGIDGLVPVGTTGEAATLSSEEQSLAVSTAVQIAQGKFPVIAGAGTFSTAATIKGVARVREAGADASLIVTPYYNKPSQEGLYAHYRAIVRAHPGFPLVLYNVPGRTAVDLLPETCQRLCEFPEVVAINEASGSMVRITEIRELCGDRLTLISGDDFTVTPFIAMGGKGVISASANVVPKMMSDLVHAALEGNFAVASSLQVKLQPLHRALFLEANPIPLKAALHLMGQYGPEIRLPLTPMAEVPRAKLLQVLRDFELVS